jgi:hypothetical protein
MVAVKRLEVFVIVERSVSEHGVEGVAATAGEGHECLVVTFALGAFPVLSGPGWRVLQCGEGGTGLA